MIEPAETRIKKMGLTPQEIKLLKQILEQNQKIIEVIIHPQWIVEAK